MTYFGVALFRRWSLKRGVLDHPNARSSHVIPTPRGGGLVLAVVTLLTYLLACQLTGFAPSWGFVGGAGLIVAVSWLDDVYSVPFFWRLLVQSGAAALLIISDGYISSISIPGFVPAFDIGRVGILLTFCWIIWLVNAYNFMDGIDGIAGVQALTAGIGWLLLGINWELPTAYVLGGTLAFVSFAFLMHNWPPARIFMGDAGSAFLGFVFAALPMLVRTENRENASVLPLAAVIFVWPFVFDSVLTFLRRAARRERVWLAHREHLYQRLVMSGNTHLSVTVLYGVISAVITAVALFALFCPTRTGSIVLFIAIFGLSAAVLILCWKRNCLFGPVKY